MTSPNATSVYSHCYWLGYNDGYNNTPASMSPPDERGAGVTNRAYWNGRAAGANARKATAKRKKEAQEAA